MLIIAAALMASGCKKSMQAIAEDTCPLIAATPDTAKLARLKMLIDDGLTATKAADLLDPYEFILPDKTVHYDKRDLCVALVSENKNETHRILDGIAGQAALMAEQQRRF